MEVSAEIIDLRTRKRREPWLADPLLLAKLLWLADRQRAAAMAGQKERDEMADAEKSLEEWIAEYKLEHPGATVEEIAAYIMTFDQADILSAEDIVRVEDAMRRGIEAAVRTGFDT
jgi:hypothetical protein